MKKFNNYGTFGCINQISYTDKNGKVTTENVSALKFLEQRNKKNAVLSNEQKKQLEFDRQVALMKKRHEDIMQWMKEYNSWPIEKKYDYFNSYLSMT